MKKKGLTYTITCNETGKTGTTTDDIDYLIDIQDDKKRMEYYMVFIGMRRIMADKDMNGTDWRVLMMLCDLMKEGGWSDITQEGLAAHIATYAANVNKSIKKLLARGYITKERHPRTRRLTLRIKSDIAGCGGHAVMKARSAQIQEAKKKEGEIE